MAAEREHTELTVLREHIDQTINGIDNLFNFAHERLEHLKNVLLRELESIYNKFRDQIIERGYELQQLKNTLLQSQQELRANALAGDL